MAKLQIFVLIVALSQAYAFVEVSHYPAALPAEEELLPKDLPSIPDLVTPPCVASIRALLKAILDQLPDVESTVPDVPEVIVPELPTPSLPIETPCSACFEHINSLLTSAEKVLAVRRMALTLRLR